MQGIPFGHYDERITEENGKKTINRTVGEHGHPIITGQMFLDNARTRLAAAKALNAERGLNNQPLEDLELKLSAFWSDEEGRRLENVFKEAKKSQVEAIKTANNLLERASEYDLQGEELVDIQRKAQVIKLNAEKEYKKAFDDMYKHHAEKLTQINALLAYYVDPDKNPKSVLKRIDKKAALMQAKEVRPDQFNMYEVDGIKVTSSHLPEGELITSQKALHKEIFDEEAPKDQLYTNPSTIRDHYQVGQANALRTEVKVGDKTVFSGHRHGSPSVLKIEDEAERQYRTMQNVRQTLAIAAKEKLEKIQKDNPVLHAQIIKGEKPLPLDMATMSLLSPVADDNPLITKKLDDPMKQYRQVNDSRQAYWSLHGREIDLEIPGQKNVKVKVNSSFMNVGVNAARGIGTLEAQALVQRINNRGLNHFVDNFLSNMKITDNKDRNNILRKFWQAETNEKIIKYLSKVKNYDKSKLHSAYNTLEKSNASLHSLSTRLKEAKADLAACNKILKDPDHRAMIDVKLFESDKIKIQNEIKILKADMKKVNKERTSALKVINKEEKKLDGYYKNLAIARKSEYKKILPGLQEMLEKYQNDKSSDALKNDKDFQKLRLFVDSLDTFYNQPQPGVKRLIQQKLATKKKKDLSKKLEKEKQKSPVDYEKCEKLAEQIQAVQNGIDALNKGNYRFQARFALLAQHMDNFVEWFCKSGEDRTGLLNEHIEAFCIFIEKHGYAPRWGNEEDSRKFHDIMPHVHNGAPNRETNGYNDKSPGVKVTDTDFEMPSVSYYTDKRIANISKETSKIGKKMDLVEKAKRIIALTPKERTANQMQIIEKFLTTFKTVHDGKKPEHREMMLIELKNYRKDRDPKVKEWANQAFKETFPEDYEMEQRRTNKSMTPAAALQRQSSPKLSTQLPKGTDDPKSRPKNTF